MKKCSIRLQSVSAELAEETTMINGCKVAALCVSEIQNENTQSMIYPMYQSLLEKNWRCLIYNTATDLFRDTPFDRGEASVFQLMDFMIHTIGY